MTPITAVFWLFIALLTTGLTIGGLLVAVLHYRGEARDLSTRLDAARARDRKTTAVQTDLDVVVAELNNLRDRYEDLADIHAADRLLIDEFIPGGFNADDFKDLS